MATFCDGIVQNIERTECIGNSLTKINSNFSGLETAGCELETRIDAIEEIIGGSSPTLIGIRLSYSSTTPTPVTDIKNATTLYVHPYKGNIIPLYDITTNKWASYKINSTVPFSLTGLLANENYDIYIFQNSGTLQIEYVKWSSSLAGSAPPARTYQDTVAVKSEELNKRLVGCLRTTGLSQSEQSLGTIDFGGSHPKQFLWNAQNVIPVTVQNFDSGSWTYDVAGWGSMTPYKRPGSTNPLDILYYRTGQVDGNGFGIGEPHPYGTAAWRRTHQSTAASTNPDGRNNRFSFIIGEQTLIDMTYQGYINGSSAGVGYVGIGINNETKPTYNGFQLIGELNGDSQTPKATFKSSVSAGFHYLQTFEVGGSTGIIWGEYHGAETGFLSSIYN